MKHSRSDPARELFDTYTRDLSREDLQRLFTHDTPQAYRFFARGLAEDRLAGRPPWKRIPLRVRQIFVAFTLKLPPARRALYITALLVALVGLLQLFRGFSQVEVPFGVPFIQVAILTPVWADGTLALLVSLLLVNLLVLLEDAGQTPPLLRRRDGRYERLGSTGVALGMFEGSAFGAIDTRLEPGETLVLYSDGITEAEDPSGRPLEESGLEEVLERHVDADAAETGTRVLAAVAAHAQDSRFADDLTVLVLKRAAPAAP